MDICNINIVILISKIHFIEINYLKYNISNKDFNEEYFSHSNKL